MYCVYSISFSCLIHQHSQYNVVPFCVSVHNYDICVKAPKEGYKRNVHAWWGMGSKLGMLVDVQVGCHDPTVHVQRFF